MSNEKNGDNPFGGWRNWTCWHVMHILKSDYKLYSTYWMPFAMEEAKGHTISDTRLKFMFNVVLKKINANTIHYKNLYALDYDSLCRYFHQWVYDNKEALLENEVQAA